MIKWEDEEDFGLQEPPGEGTGLLKYFAYNHLKEPMRTLSKAFHRQATYLEAALPTGSEKTVALRKLLEAKDAAVRSLAVDGKD